MSPRLCWDADRREAMLCNEYISDSSNIWPSVAFLSPLAPTGGCHYGLPPSPLSLIRLPPISQLLVPTIIWQNINKCRENIERKSVLHAELFLTSVCVGKKIIFTQYLCKPNVSPEQQIRSKNKYFVFYWQTQVFDEEKVNHWIWTISCRNNCFDPSSSYFVVEVK